MTLIKKQNEYKLNVYQVHIYAHKELCTFKIRIKKNHYLYYMTLPLKYGTILNSFQYDRYHFSK